MKPKENLQKTYSIGSRKGRVLNHFIIEETLFSKTTHNNPDELVNMGLNNIFFAFS
jgi:hypothetical protein